MLYFIGVAFLQSLKWAILFIYTRDGSTFTFKLKPHYICFNLRPGGGGTAIYGLGTYLPLGQVGFFLSSSVWRVDSATPHPKFLEYPLPPSSTPSPRFRRICSPFVLVLRRKSFCINIAFFRYKVLAKKGWMNECYLRRFMNSVWSRMVSRPLSMK